MTKLNELLEKKLIIVNKYDDTKAYLMWVDASFQASENATNRELIRAVIPVLKEIEEITKEEEYGK